MTDDRLAPLLARIDELEAQAAFQDDLHRRLDETVARQDREILELKRQLKALGERIADLDAGAVGVSSSVDEVPPHY